MCWILSLAFMIVYFINGLDSMVLIASSIFAVAAAIVEVAVKINKKE